MKLLHDLCLISSKSKSEKPVVEFIKAYAEKIPNTTVTVDNFDNIYIVRGQSDTYPCMVAHTDTVFDNSKVDVKFIRVDDIYFGYDTKTKKSVGMGFDDKTGIYVALKMLQKFSVFKCAFFVSEEIGCVGSSNADMDFFEDCRFVLQCDRRNNSDLITSVSGTKILSDDMLKAINPKEYGYIETTGLMTDVYKLRTKGLKIASCNISCGYYNPHSAEEAQSITDLEKCMKFVDHIITDCTDVYPFPVEKTQPSITYHYGNYYDSYYSSSKIIPEKYKNAAWNKRTIIEQASNYFDKNWPWIKFTDFNSKLPSYCQTIYTAKEIQEIYDDFEQEYIIRLGYYDTWSDY